MKSISEKIKNDEVEHSFHTIIAKTMFLSAITLIFVLQICRVFFYSFVLKMAILFTRIWNEDVFRKPDSDNLNAEDIRRDRERYVDVEGERVSEGLGFV
jgi:hypothetical protein